MLVFPGIADFCIPHEEDENSNKFSNISWMFTRWKYFHVLLFMLLVWRRQNILCCNFLVKIEEVTNVWVLTTSGGPRDFMYVSLSFQKACLVHG